MSDLVPVNESLESNIRLTHIIYALYAAGFLTGITWIVAIGMNYVKRDDVRGTFLESHFIWQIRTFWWSLLWSILGCVLAVVVVGFAILFVNVVWVIYRLVKGWINLNDGKPMTL